MPEALRESVASRVPGELRNRMVMAVANTRSRPMELASRLTSSVAADVRLRGHQHGRFAHVSIVQGRARLGTAPGPVLPAEAGLYNLNRICAELERAGIEYIRVRPREFTRTAVAIPQSQRESVVRVLSERFHREPAYIAGVNRRGEQEEAEYCTIRRSSWKRLAHAPVIRFWHYFVVADRAYAHGSEVGCDIEFWPADGKGRLLAAQPNRATGEVPLEFTAIKLPDEAFGAFRPAGRSTLEVVERNDPGNYPTHPYFAAPLIDDITFPIDAVYTWVDGDDPVWSARRDAALGQVDLTVRLSDQATNAARFMSRDELRYSLRSVAAFAPWFRRIFLVTDQQVPRWLTTEDERITIVDHKEIFSDVSVLPTFNSHAIESQLHHIDGLSEHFVYFNDDVFLGRPVPPSLFFHSNGVSRFFPSKALLPMGPHRPDDTPVAASGKNNRDLIEQLTGKAIAAKMRHVPHALRRSVLAEIEERYPERVAETAGHRFRHPQDLAIASSLAHYYAYTTGRAIPDTSLEYDYVDLAQPSSPRRLNRFLAERRFDVFCLNDTTSEPAMYARQTAMLNWFLGEYFPVPSSFEADAAGSRPQGA
jgi:hypothetical protein